MQKRILKIIFLLFLFENNIAFCQIYWEKLFDSLSYKVNEKPPPRRDSAVGFDIDRSRVIIFGGRQSNNNNYEPNSIFTMPVIFDDTWEFNLKTKTWRPLSFSSKKPSARYGMLYTHNKYGLYISCGRGLFEEYFNDLWVYDFSEDQWNKMDQSFISIIPEPRYSPIGGLYPSYEYSNLNFKNNLILGMGRSQYEMFDNMFVFEFTDLRSLNGLWERVYTDILTGPFSFTHPHGRSFASSALISADELIIHSGCLSGAFSGGPCPSSDSWLYTISKNKWEKIDSSCLSPRLYSSMASLVSDGSRKSAVIFSGQENDRTILSYNKELENEIALYDNFAKKWIIKKVQGLFFPEKRNGHVMCTGKINSEYGVFMFGGDGHSSERSLADLWFLKINLTYAFENYYSSSSFSAGANEKHNQSNCSLNFSTIHLHALFMFFGWAFCLNISNIMSYYFGEKLNRFAYITKIFLVLLGIFSLTIGILLGFWSTHGLPHLAHMIIGLFAYFLAIFHPIAKILKKLTKKTEYFIDEDEKSKSIKRKSGSIYNISQFLYRNLSYSAILLAYINISLGIFYAVFDWIFILIWFCYLGGSLLLYLFFEFRKYNIETKKKYLNEKKNLKEDLDESFFEENYSNHESGQRLNKENIKMNALNNESPNKVTSRNSYIKTQNNKQVISTIDSLSFAPKNIVSNVNGHILTHNTVNGRNLEHLGVSNKSFIEETNTNEKVKLNLDYLFRSRLK